MPFLHLLDNNFLEGPFNYGTWTDGNIHGILWLIVVVAPTHIDGMQISENELDIGKW